jgi:hypothetical protein
VLITSRSAAEYRAMFGLTPADLAEVSVVDCSAGGSSLAAESTGNVLAVDPAYSLPYGELESRLMTGLRDGNQIIEANQDHFEWSWYGDIERRNSIRTTAAHTFLTDFRAHPGRYIAGELPHLPLADKSADLVLSSHLLFTWSGQFGLDWHRRALADMMRVARREVRLFPLVVQGTGEPVPFLDTILTELPEARLCPVSYRFQRGADHMLLVKSG